MRLSLNWQDFVGSNIHVGLGTVIPPANEIAG